MTERAVSGHPLAGHLGRNKRAAIIRLAPLFAIGLALSIVVAFGRGPRLLTVGIPERGTQWTVHIQKMDEALARKSVRAAERAWQEALGEALRSPRWEAMLEVGDASLRIGNGAGFQAAALPRARQAYLAAFFRARQQGSLDGMLKVAEAFASLGDREVVQQCLAAAEILAAEASDPRAQQRVRALRDRLVSPVGGGYFAPKAF